MNGAPPVIETRDLPVTLLDPPQLDARIDRDEAQLDELAHDISRRGIIYPIIVVRVGARYEIVDGYTRCICARRVGLPVVPCRIYPSKDDALEGIKYAANIFRLDMSPCEEAVMFNELLGKECADDIDRLCALVGKKLSYVDARLALLRGFPDVFEALRAKTIGVGVAEELNKVPADNYRRHYLEHAIRGGATRAVVAQWVQEWKTSLSPEATLTPAPAAVEAGLPDPAWNPFTCEVCGKADNVHLIRQINVHQHCKLAILDPLLAHARGES